MKGVTQTDFAERAGLSQSGLHKILHGSEPTLETLIAVAKAAGVSVGWLAAGETSSPPPIGDGQVVLVPRLAFQASAGNGSLVVDEAASNVRFPRSILERIGLKPANARLLEASGDSMRPTIEDGDPLLVDVTATEIAEGKIYVFTVGDDVMVKRLRRRSGRLLMRSDNRGLYPDEEEVPAGEPVRIIGRVRWTGRQL